LLFFWGTKNDKTVVCLKIIVSCKTIKLNSLLLFSGIIATINNAFNALDIRNWKTKLIGSSADGASVNLGEKANVAAKLKEDTPRLIDIHCLPHRLELALHLIWKTHHNSPKSTRDVKAVADTMGIGVLKTGQVKRTRWLRNVSCALKSLIKPSKGHPHNDPCQYAAVLQHMEHLASTPQKADIKGRAKYIAFSGNSLKFQQNDLILPSPVSLLRETYAKVSILPKRAAPGGWFESFDKVVKKSDDKVLFQGVTVVRSSQQKRGKESSDLQSEVDLAVELCKHRHREQFSNLLEASSEKLHKEKSTANTIVCDMLVFNVGA